MTFFYRLISMIKTLSSLKSVQFISIKPTMFTWGFKLLRVKCLHGFFIMDETTFGEVSEFMRLSGLEVSPWRNKFTFADLIDAPDYSLAGQKLLGTPAIKTFEGEPWEVFEANGFIYNFLTGLLIPIQSVTTLVSISVAGNRFTTSGLILPGSLNDDGDRVKDYSAWYSWPAKRWIYSEINYV